MVLWGSVAFVANLSAYACLCLALPLKLGNTMKMCPVLFRTLQGTHRQVFYL